MPLSSVFEKLKIRRGSNPPSPTSSTREGRVSSDHHRARGSIDRPRVSSQGGRAGDALPAHNGVEPEHTGFGGQTLVGDHGHIDGQTEVARNLNEQFEHGFQPQQHHVPSPSQQRTSEPRDLESSRTGSGLNSHSQSHSTKGEDKGLPPIPVVGNARGHADDDRHQQARVAPVSVQKTPSKVSSTHSNALGKQNQKFDADGFPIVGKTSTQTSTTSSESDRSGLPRSHGTFALPTVPQTPAFSDEVQAGLLNRASTGPSLREKFETDAGSMGYVPVDSHRHGLGFVDKNAVETGVKSEWRETNMRPLIQDHQLVAPRQLAPYAVPDARAVQEESRRFIASQSRASRAEPNQVGTLTTSGQRDQGLSTAGSIQSANTAYLPVREYTFHPSPPGATEPSAEHIQRHLALLSQSFNHSRMSKVGATKPGRYVPLIPGIPVSTTDRDRELTNQREGLVSRIAREESVSERSGARGVKAKNGLDERSVEVFKRAGWESKVGVLDTVDVRTRVMEPVIQEHVAVLETEVYELMIFRDIHKYHIYPFIQPINDPEPKVLPTRHLFKDAQGQWREVIGDEAAERILGTRIDRSEGSIYTERWTESVSGIEYEAIERESVVVGRRGWVQLVGERLFVGGSTGTGHHVSSSSHHGTSAIADVEPKPRKSSFSATSPGRPVGHRSARDAPPVPTDHVNAHRSVPSSGQIGRAL